MARTEPPDPPPSQPYRLSMSGRVLPMAQPHDCVTALRALGEETRVRIVGLLMERPREVGDIADTLGVSQYNVSKHLRVLREAGLLEVEKDGRLRKYALPAAIMRQAAEGRVLDLGCCRFQFEDDASGRRDAGAGQPQAKRGSADQKDARRKHPQRRSVRAG
jgi:DNA-binding transcriptional ArsR family regulator